MLYIQSQNCFQIIVVKLVPPDEVVEWERKGSMVYVSYIYFGHVEVK